MNDFRIKPRSEFDATTEDFVADVSAALKEGRQAEYETRIKQFSQHLANDEYKHKFILERLHDMYVRTKSLGEEEQDFARICLCRGMYAMAYQTTQHFARRGFDQALTPEWSRDARVALMQGLYDTAKVFDADTSSNKYTAAVQEGVMTKLARESQDASSRLATMVCGIVDAGIEDAMPAIIASLKTDGQQLPAIFGALEADSDPETMTDEFRVKAKPTDSTPRGRCVQTLITEFPHVRPEAGAQVPTGVSLAFSAEAELPKGIVLTGTIDPDPVRKPSLIARLFARGPKGRR